MRSRDAGVHASANPGQVIESWARTMCVPQHSLHISYKCRGIVHGSLRVTAQDGTQICCWCQPEHGIQIPHALWTDKESTIDCGAEVLQPSAAPDGLKSQIVLVIEKESVFQRLLDDGFCERVMGSKILLVTGCGVPPRALKPDESQGSPTSQPGCFSIALRRR